MCGQMHFTLHSELILLPGPDGDVVAHCCLSLRETDREFKWSFTVVLQKKKT